MDAKADRKEKTLIIHNLHFEALKLNKPQLLQMAAAIQSFADFNQCKTQLIKKTNNRGYAETISKNL
jgi:uncharacterized protein